MDFIYVTSITDDVKKAIEKELRVNVVERPLKWTINELMTFITDTNLQVIVVNEIDSQAIVEIALGHLFCKKILVTCNSIDEYPHIYDMITEVQVTCNLMLNNNSFINWYQYTKK